MSVWPSSSAALAGLTEPPYWIRIRLRRRLVAGGDQRADEPAGVVRLLGGRGLAGADRPDRLVGDDDVGEAARPRPATGRRRSGGAATGSVSSPLALGLGLADAEDRQQPRRQRRRHLAGERLVGLAEELPPLGVAEDDRLGAGVEQHRRRDLSGEGAGVLEVHVLRRRRRRRIPAQSCATSGSARNDGQIDDLGGRRRRAPRRRAAAPRRTARASPDRLVHLPVRRDQRTPCHRQLRSSSPASRSASTPGSGLPSISSSDAPPPVDSQLDLVGEPELVQRGARVAAADDRRRVGARDRLGDRPRAGRERRHLEDAHRAVPEDRPGGARSRRRRRARVAGPMSRPIIPSGTSTPSIATGSASAEKLAPRTRSVGSASAQSEPAASSSAPGGELDPLLLDQRVADLEALGAEEGEAHRPADQDRVDDLEEPLDDADLVGDLGAAEDDDERAVRVVEDRGQLATSRSSSRPA